ncbi:hypothetical protein D9613_009737 [Agrocybe pediades]|uniref:Uncharacterized protein n=1 Tax=Agrocybe pediades TaxID=84607 RepID=A0A8H4QYX5_9AGAR|nr:hypothetical protein D9613_009737 [Agrocybe pediades]
MAAPFDNTKAVANTRQTNPLPSNTSSPTALLATKQRTDLLLQAATGTALHHSGPEAARPGTPRKDVARAVTARAAGLDTRSSAARPLSTARPKNALGKPVRATIYPLWPSLGEGSKYVNRLFENRIKKSTLTTQVFFGNKQRNIAQ